MSVKVKQPAANNCGKVLFVAPSAYPLGGVQTWLDYVIPGIEKHGFQSTLALTSGQFHNVDEYLNVHPFTAVEVVSCKTGTKRGRVRSLEKTITKVDPDIILVVNIHDVYQAVNNLRRRNKTNARVVSTLHGIHPGLTKDIDLYSQVIDGVITTNRLTQRLVREKTKVPSERCYYAPYGVELARTKRQQEGQFTLAYVGRIEEDQKCINDLLKIFERVLAQFPNIQILVAGDGPELNAFLDWRERIEASANINYLGVLTPKELKRQVYSKADALILTSSWETGPIVAWEAMTHGVSLISSRYIGHSEEGSLQHEHNCLLFDIGDVDGATEQISRASKLKARKHLNANAQALVESKYSIAHSIASWADCLRQIQSHSPLAQVDQLTAYEDSGRLTKLFKSIFGRRGLDLSEALRRLTAYRFHHTSPGSEWPHCFSSIDSSSTSLKDFVK